MGWFSKKKERPDAIDVAIRAVVLRHVVSYGSLLPLPDSVRSNSLWWTDAEKREFSRDSQRSRDEFWKRLGPYRKHLSPKETVFSRMTLDSVADQPIVDAGWRIESLLTLLWALNVVDRLPDYDVQAHPDMMNGFRDAEMDEFVRGAELRPREEIDHARDVAESWHWRSRTRGLIEDGAEFPKDPQLAAAGFYSFDDIVRKTAALHADDGTFSAMIDEDYPALGKAYRDLTAEEWWNVRSVTMERHFALNWLCGYAPGHRWDDTPTDT